MRKVKRVPAPGDDLKIPEGLDHETFCQQIGGDCDDISDKFPTFAAKRHPFSKRYSPLNKADVTAKWFASASAPGPDEVIVMVDPDNWLLRPLDEYTAQVKPGHAMAEAAWFVGQGPLVRAVAQGGPSAWVLSFYKTIFICISR